MSTPLKGLSSKNIKPNATNFDFVSVEPVKQNQFGLSVAAQMYMQLIIADAVEAGSTVNQIVATAHVALAGDVISFTSGALSGIEVRVKSVDTNNIYLAEDLSSAPIAADTFNILRSKTPVVDSLGNISIAISSISGAEAEDSPHASGDVGLFCLGVRNDTNAVMTSTDGDYSPLTTDNTGRLRVDASFTEQATVADGGALPAVVKVVGGYDGANVQVIKTDAAGELQVDILTQPARSHTTDSIKIGDGVDFVSVTAANQMEVAVTASLPAGTNNIGDVDVLTEPATVADGGALPAVVKVVGGYDGANVQAILTDASGRVVTNINSMPSTYAEDSAHVSGDIGSQVLAVRNDAGTNLVSADGDYAPLQVDSSGALRVTEQATAADGGALPSLTKVISGYDGANVQVIKTDVAGELQVDVLTLPGSLRGYTEDSAHVSGDFGAMALAVRNDAGSSLVGTDGDYAPLQVDANGSLRVTSSSSGRSKVNLIRNAYATTNVTTAAYVQLVASTAATINLLDVFDSSGETLVFAVGAAAAEVDQFYIAPGGNGRIELAIPSGSRLSVKAISATASVGELIINSFS